MELFLRHIVGFLAGISVGGVVGFILGRISRKLEFGGIIRGTIVVVLVGLLVYVTVSSIPTAAHPQYTPSTFLVGFLAVTIGTYMKPDILEKLLPYIPFLSNGKRAETPGEQPTTEGGHRGQENTGRRHRKGAPRRRRA